VGKKVQKMKTPRGGPSYFSIQIKAKTGQRAPSVFRPTQSLVKAVKAWVVNDIFPIIKNKRGVQSGGIKGHGNPKQ
jgi:hypothetical protein